MKNMWWARYRFWNALQKHLELLLLSILDVAVLCAQLLGYWKFFIGIFKIFLSFLLYPFPCFLFSFLYCSNFFIGVSVHIVWKWKWMAKKLSRFQFNFPGLLGTSPMSKQDTKYFSIIVLWRISHLFIWVSRWTGPRISFEKSKVLFFIVIQLCYNELWSFFH